MFVRTLDERGEETRCRPRAGQVQLRLSLGQAKNGVDRTKPELGTFSFSGTESMTERTSDT